jgi:hypothetical protein
VFKSFISFLLIFSVFTVHAQASTVEGLKKAFDELHFSLEHDWDQQDRSFYEAQMKKFNQELRNLQAQGLTSDQLLDFAKSQTKNPQMGKDLETAFTMIKINKMSSSEANRYVLDVMKKSYSRGASWTGEVFIYAAIGILIVALAIGLASGASGSSSSSGGGYSSSCYYDDIYLCDTYCYDDYWYGYTCYDDCYWSTQYMCY